MKKSETRLLTVRTLFFSRVVEQNGRQQHLGGNCLDFFWGQREQAVDASSRRPRALGAFHDAGPRRYLAAISFLPQFIGGERSQYSHPLPYGPAAGSVRPRRARESL